MSAMDELELPAHADAANAARTDAELVARFLARRDDDAFLALYRRHAARVYGLLLRLTGGRGAEADEGMQETWVRAIRGLERFEGRSTLSTWLAGIAIHWWREESRKRTREAELPGEDLLPPAAPLRREIVRVDLERALARLPGGYREAILLHDVQGYTHEEIAAMTAVEPGTSKSQLSRARSALRAHLAGGRA
jgi:RNA polymerase sigma factor (sigma-70 family)